jgi:hypothetical protein
MRTNLKVTLLALCALLLVAAVASAATVTGTGTFRGTTSQGYKMFVRVNDDNSVRQINVPWITTHCSGTDGYSLRSKRFVYNAPIKRTGNKFSDHGTSKIPSKSGSATVKAHVKGKFTGNKVTGTQDMSLVVKDKFGRHTCTSHATFSAKLVK